MIKVCSKDIEMSFDVIDVKDREGIMVMTIKIEFSPCMQKVSYQLRNVRIEKTAFSDFEEQLVAGGPAELVDASVLPVLAIRNEKKYVEIEVQPASDLKDSEYSQLSITMRAEPDIMQKMAAAFRKYPKWW